MEGPMEGPMEGHAGGGGGGRRRRGGRDDGGLRCGGAGGHPERAARGRSRGGTQVNNDSAHVTVRILCDLGAQHFLPGGLRAKSFRIDGHHLNRRITAGSRRAERAQGPRPLIVRAEEKRHQSVGSGIDKQHALAAAGERTAKRCRQTRFANSTGKRKDGHHRRARRRRSRCDFRLRGCPIEHSAQRIPAGRKTIARSLQRVFRRSLRWRANRRLWLLRH